jgi:TPR repeat protein
MLWGMSPQLAEAGSLQQGITAHQRHDYVKAARILLPFARAGNARAQTLVGFMYEHGRGLPQNYVEAAIWYCLAADQGNPYAQYLLGLLHDNGHGVERNYVEAYKWLTLATAGASRNEREAWKRVRDAVASKMTVEEIALGQELAVQWRPKVAIRRPVSLGKAPAAAAVTVERK